MRASPKPPTACAARRRARRLADDLLEFTGARMGHGLAVKIVPIGLHVLVGELVGDLGAAHRPGALRHVVEGQGSVMADPNRLAQMLGNLVGNALAYGDQNAPVTIRSRIATDDWSLAVHNHGSAIDATLLPQLFLPMVRGDDHSGSSGVGLGLYIVERIVDAHGGAMHVTSDAELGTEFVARFARQKPAATPV